MDAASPEYVVTILASAVLFGRVAGPCYTFDAIQFPRRHVLDLLGAWSATVACALLLLYLEKVSGDVSRLWMISWSIACFGGVFGVRCFAAKMIARSTEHGDLAPRVAIVAPDFRAWRNAERLQRRWNKGIKIAGIFSLSDPSLHSPINALCGAPPSGSLQDLIRLARSTAVDEIVVIVPRRVRKEMREALRRLSSLPVNISLVPEALLDLPECKVALTSIHETPVLTVSARPLGGSQLFLKRAFDWVGALAAIVFWMPVMLLIAVAIRLDSPGPVLFRQQRYGFNNNIITVHKFRTMRSGGEVDPNVPQARRDDVRVTRVGRLLRRTSLDELPQLFDVLIGEMSLVGPRPHAVAHNEKYATIIDGYFARHRVRPGITGWAQVNGLRGEADDHLMEKRVEHDLYYIENWSLELDLRILLRTLVVGFVHRNAY